MTDFDRYPISVFWSDEDEGFIAIAPDLPGLSAFGKTAEEALREVRGTIPTALDAIAAVGNPVPKPSKYDPEQQYSGKVLVRMPRTLHGKLAERAKRENVSLNQCITYLLAAGVSTAPSKNDEAFPRASDVVRIPHSGSTHPKLTAETYHRAIAALGWTSVHLPEGCGSLAWLKEQVVTTNNRTLEGLEWQPQISTASH